MPLDVMIWHLRPLSVYPGLCWPDISPKAISINCRLIAEAVDVSPNPCLIAGHVRPQHFRHGNAPVLFLIVFKDGNQGSAYGNGRSVQCVYELGLTPALRAASYV